MRTILVMGFITSLFVHLTFAKSDIAVPGLVCDNTVNHCEWIACSNVELETDSTTFTATICPGDSILVNDTYYSMSRPTGVEILQNSEGFDSVVVVSISFLAEPEIRLFDTVLCVGESLDVNGITYDEDNSSGIQVIASEIGGCDSLVVEIHVFFDRLEVEAGAVPPWCPGNPGTVVVNAADGRFPPFFLSLNDGFPIETSAFPVEIATSVSGLNILSVTDSRGCTTFDTVLLESSGAAEILIDSVVVVRNEVEVVLQPEISFPYDHIFWSPEEGLSCSDCEMPFVTEGPDRIVTVTAESDAGCGASAQIFLRFESVASVYAPNVFSPNSDGFNDYFTVFVKNHTSTRASLSVFDMWGNLVFEKSDFPPNVPEEGWDGRFSGERLDPGVFVFYAVLSTDGVGQEVVSGDVTLIR